MIKKQRFMLNTNKLEAIHTVTLHAVPKRKLFTRSYKARCLNTVLQVSKGWKRNAEDTAKALGYSFGADAKTKLKKIQERAVYFAKRSQSARQKRSRYLVMQARLQRRQIPRFEVTSKGLKPINRDIFD